MPSRTFPSIAPVRPAPTILSLGLGAADPATSSDAHTGWIALRTPAGPAALAVAPRGNLFEATAWGPGSDAALELAPDLIGATDDPTGFDPPGRVGRWLRTHSHLRITRSRMITAAMLRAVVGQKVTGKEAKRSYHRLARSLGEPAPGPRPGLLLPPDPDLIATLSYEEFHTWGIERRRAETMIEVARRRRRLEEAGDMNLDDAYRRLTALRGVGEWTAALVGMQALGDADAVPVGDYNLPSAITWALAGERSGTDDRMLELLDEYRPHRSRVIKLVKAVAGKPPRRGPRAPLRSIERM